MYMKRNCRVHRYQVAAQLTLTGATQTHMSFQGCITVDAQAPLSTTFVAGKRCYDHVANRLLDMSENLCRQTNHDHPHVPECTVSGKSSSLVLGVFNYTASAHCSKLVLKWLGHSFTGNTQRTVNWQKSRLWYRTSF